MSFAWSIRKHTQSGVTEVWDEAASACTNVWSGVKVGKTVNKLWGHVSDTANTHEQVRRWKDEAIKQAQLNVAFDSKYVMQSIKVSYV